MTAEQLKVVLQLARSYSSPGDQSRIMNVIPDILISILEIMEKQQEKQNGQ